MNGKQSKALRRLLGIKKPTQATDSGLETKQTEHGPVLLFRQRRNPEMNFYRSMKRRFTRGW